MLIFALVCHVFQQTPSIKVNASTESSELSLAASYALHVYDVFLEVYLCL